jgi:hypothetical protein
MKVNNFILDTEGCGSKSEDAANGIEHSLKRLSVDDDAPRQLSSTSTDSGGGGVLESLANELDQRNLLILERFITSCNLHGIQRPLVNSVEGYMGDGGLGKRTLLQLLHSRSTEMLSWCRVW